AFRERPTRPRMEAQLAAVEAEVREAGSLVPGRLASQGTTQALASPERRAAWPRLRRPSRPARAERGTNQRRRCCDPRSRRCSRPARRRRKTTPARRRARLAPCFRTDSHARPWMKTDAMLAQRRWRSNDFARGSVGLRCLLSDRPGAAAPGALGRQGISAIAVSDLVAARRERSGPSSLPS